MLLAISLATILQSETDLLPGRSMIEKLNGVSQLDNLSSTKNDAERCACAAGISAYLLLGGDWLKLAKRFKVGTELTYENIHLLQDRLYAIGNVDNEAGIYGSARPIFDKKDRVVGWRLPKGEEANAMFKKMGLKVWPLYGNTKENVMDRTAAVESYLKRNPSGVLIAGVDEDSKNFLTRPVQKGQFANHYIAVARVNGVNLRIDSWAKPGSKTVHPMSDLEFKQIVYESPVSLFATGLR